MPRGDGHINNYGLTYYDDLSLPNSDFGGLIKSMASMAKLHKLSPLMEFSGDMMF